jgi:hypothetical protein
MANDRVSTMGEFCLSFPLPGEMWSCCKDPNLFRYFRNSQRKGDRDRKSNTMKTIFRHSRVLRIEFDSLPILGHRASMRDEGSDELWFNFHLSSIPGGQEWGENQILSGGLGSA